MRKYNQSCVIYFCLSMTQKGRGFVSPDILCAAVKFPESQEEILASFFCSIHEMTHQFMAEITLKSAAAKPGAASTMSENGGYQIHRLSIVLDIFGHTLGTTCQSRSDFKQNLHIL
jgi:hypothetical protein